MKLSLLTTLLSLAVFSCAFAQQPASCVPTAQLLELYDTDVKSLALKRIMETGGPDALEIDIPQARQDTIWESLAAIFNSNTPASDSVFRMWCVHDRAYNPAVFGVIIGVEPESTIAQAWSSGQTLTGNDYLDSLLIRYEFSLTNYISFGAGVLYSDHLLNLNALGQALVANVPGVLYGEPDLLIGAAGIISFAVEPSGARLLNFSAEWNDCFDGCDNRYTWYFKVDEDCSAAFLGSDNQGFFGVEPLPAPTNCITPNAVEAPALDAMQWAVFPNPTTDRLQISSNETVKEWRIFDHGGKLVAHGLQYENGIDVGSLPAGAYSISAKTTSGAWRSGTFVKH